MSNLEDRIREIERQLSAAADREAIRELPAQYCHAVASGNGPAIVALFTDDGSMEGGAIPAIGQGDILVRGRAELDKTYGEATSDMRLRPFIHNHVIELDGDRATGKCAVEIRSVRDGIAYNAAGYYDDTYRRESGEWKFERRYLHIDFWVPATESWA